MSRKWSLTVGAVWLCALVGVVIGAYATRSRFAGTNAGAGPTLIALMLPSIIVAALWIRYAPLLGIVVLSAGVWTCAVSWGVLRDESSTAAFGVFLVPLLSFVIVVCGAGIEAFVRRGGRRALRG